MRKLKVLALSMVGLFLIQSCSESDLGVVNEEVPGHVLAALVDAGFDIDTQAPIVFDDGYLVEGDIYIPSAEISQLSRGIRIPVEEQYSTTNLVNATGGRVITVYAPEASSGGGGRGKKGGGSEGYSPAMIAGIDEAIARYNAENLDITFVRIQDSNADIVMTRLNKRDERRGVLGSAGFPTSSGDPYGEIKMSGVLESSYGLTTDEIASIIAHEMGHCIGLRHTDYFDRSISCGGSPTNEGDGGVGANHIPGTPTDADLQGNGSYMLSCTDGSNRPFTNADQTALDYLY